MNSIICGTLANQGLLLSYCFRRIIQILGVNQPSAWEPGAYTVAESQIRSLENFISPHQSYCPWFEAVHLYLGWAE